VPARDVAFSADGNLYATDGAIVRRISFSGVVSIAAGGGKDPKSGSGGVYVAFALPNVGKR